MKTISYLICTVIIALFYVSSSEAQSSVPWYYQRYTVVAAAAVDGGTEEVVVSAYPPYSLLPIGAVVDTAVASATCNISSSSMYAKVLVKDTNAHLGGGSAFNVFFGEYIANSEFFQFSYDLSTNVTPPFTWLQVNDLTTSDNLYFESLNHNTSDLITVPTLAGHVIEVRINNELFNSIYSSQEATLNYNMSTAPVVPEPISSILFVTGGTLLAGRRYLKRRKA